MTQFYDPVAEPPSYGFFSDQIRTRPTGGHFTGQSIVLPRIAGFYTAVTRIGYNVLPSGAGLPPVVPPHRIRIAWQSVPQGSTPAASQISAAAYILKDDSLDAFFTIESDGARGIQPPFTTGGDQPYQLVIWTDGGVAAQLRQLEVQWRWVRRAQLIPGSSPPPCR